MIIMKIHDVKQINLIKNFKQKALTYLKKLNIVSLITLYNKSKHIPEIIKCFRF